MANKGNKGNGFTQKEINVMILDKLDIIDKKLDKSIEKNNEEHDDLHNRIWRLKVSWVTAIVLAIPAVAGVVFIIVRIGG